jgi:hypothetical protein
MASRHNSILPYRPLGSNQETQDFTHQYLARVETPVVTNVERREDASKRKLDRFIDPALIMLMLVSYPDQDNIESTATYISIDIELWQNDRYTSAFPLYSPSWDRSCGYRRRAAGFVEAFVLPLSRRLR